MVDPVLFLQLFWVFFVPIASLMMLLALPDTYDAVGMLLR